MNRKFLIGITIVVLIALTLYVLRPTNLKNKFDKSLTKLDSYYMEGKMEVIYGEDIKTFSIKVSYEKRNEEDYFKVEQYDENLKQDQIILRNQEGVFVMTPSLNQVFKFKGDWPYNSQKPYLYHSMLKVLEKDYKLDKEKDGYLITSKADYPNAPQLTNQIIKLDKELKPIYIEVKNDQGVSMIKVTFDKVVFNEKFPDNYFDMNSNLSGEQNLPTSSGDYLPLYPVEIFDTKLVGNAQVNVEGNTQHILTFEGEKDFTLIQVAAKPQNELKVVEEEGQLIDMGTTFGIYDGNSLKVYSEGNEFTVYSQSLEVSEMIQILNSMQVSAIK